VMMTQGPWWLSSVCWVGGLTPILKASISAVCVPEMVMDFMLMK